jgi:hypothetical protein
MDAEAGADDVFGDAELKDFKPRGADAEMAGEKDRLVKFQVRNARESDKKWEI